MTLFSKQVVAAADDVGTWASGTQFSSTLLHMGEYGGAGYRESCFRITNVTIPNGSTIATAYLTIYESGLATTTEVRLKLRGNDIDDAVSPTSVAEFNALALTAGVDWDIVATWADDTGYPSPDIAAIIQAIVNRVGWASGQAMIIVVKDDGSTAGNWRKSHDYATDAAKTAQLDITYTAPSPTTVTPAPATVDVRTRLLVSPTPPAPSPSTAPRRGPAFMIRVLDPAGALVALIDQPPAFSFTRRVNCAGAYALRLDGNDPKRALFELDGQLEFWWRDAANGVDWTLEFEGFHRWAKTRRDSDGALWFESGGRGYVDLLNRRVIAAAAGSAQASKTGVAETVMKAYVDEQAGPGAGARALTGLTVQADGTRGNAVTLGRAYRNVLEVLKELAAVGGGDFDVIGTGAATFEFRWYTGQRGADRTATVIFADERGNMGSAELNQNRAEEVDAVLVGGQGEGAARTTVWRTDAGRIADSPWNRVEEFIQATNESTVGGLNQAGDAELEEKRPKNELTFDVLQLPGCMYGKHYFFGDLVTARFGGYTWTKKVVEVSVTADKDGLHKSVSLEDVP